MALDRSSDHGEGSGNLEKPPSEVPRHWSHVVGEETEVWPEVAQGINSRTGKIPRAGAILLSLVLNSVSPPAAV